MAKKKAVQEPQDEVEQEQPEQSARTWTRGNDPVAAAAATKAANTGSTGGHMNAPIPRTTAS